MGKILIIKGADFSANSFDKDNLGQEENLNEKIAWRGILGGSEFDATVFATMSVGSPIGSNLIELSSSLSYERSVGILDVSEYVGRRISMTFGQNKTTPDEYKYCCFISGSPDDSNSLLVEKFNNWNEGPITELNTITVTVPVGARYLCFSHAQESVSPFNGNIILLSEQ